MKFDAPVIMFDVTIHGTSSNIRRKDLSNDTASAHNADSEAIQTFVEKVPAIIAKDIKSREQAIRNYFDRNAIRFSKLFAVPIAAYEEFNKNLIPLLTEYDEAIEKAVAAVTDGTYAESLRGSLGDLYDASKIPTADAVRGAYGVDIKVDADLEQPGVRQALNVIEETVKSKLLEQIQVDSERAADERNTSMCGFVHDVIDGFLSDVQDRCSRGDDQKTKWATLVGKARRVIDVMPKYDMGNCPEVTKALGDIGKVFGNWDKDDYKSAEVRAIAVSEARRIAAELA